MRRVYFRPMSRRHLASQPTLAAAALLAAFHFACSDSNGGNEAPPDAGFPDAGPPDSGIAPILGTLTVDVSGVFSAGETLTDAYSGRTLTVGTDGNVDVSYGANKVALLERASSTGQSTPFSWDNATIYFMLTDRFENGDPNNDDNFGRKALEAPGETVGTFHGGDFAGIVQRLDYLESLGVDAIWITPPVEQLRGWVGGGGQGDFQYFPYHGYWAGDFTRLDPNFGTEDDLRTLVREAHARNIRILFDVVLNHPGYLNIVEASLYVPNAIGPNSLSWTPGPNENWQSFNNDPSLINYKEPTLTEWWGVDWIRAGDSMANKDFPGYDPNGGTVQTDDVAFLPDFKTESTKIVDPPPLFANKADTGVVKIDDATVRDYLIAWHTRWVRDFGIDGFRADTAKHVELAAWQALKNAATTALAEWKTNNPNDKIDDEPFWMVGEAFPPVANPPRDQYFTNGGFDAMINFDFERSAEGRVENYDLLEAFYSFWAPVVAAPGRQELTYASSHDTRLFYDVTEGDLELQFRLAQALLMMPGAVQIFYGDESARPPGPDVSDGEQKTRSDMNWTEIDSGDRDDLLDHWRRIGKFRQRHRAVGMGAHAELPIDGNGGYAFSRQYDDGTIDDDVVIVLAD